MPMKMRVRLLMTTPRPTGTPADPPGGCGPAWERPGARPAPAPRSKRPFVGQELAQQAMEVVHATFACRRIAAAAVPVRADAALHRFDGGFVFHLDLVEPAAGAGVELVGLPDEGAKTDAA